MTRVKNIPASYGFAPLWLRAFLGVPYLKGKMIAIKIGGK